MICGSRPTSYEESITRRETDKEMKAFKGFDKDLKCRGFQYEIGGTYEEPKAELCAAGFHACEDPLGVLGYYPPADSRYCEVELEWTTEEKEDDTKVCGTKITVGAEIGIPGLIKAHFEYVNERVKESIEKGDSEAATAGDRGAATAGDMGAATARGQAAVGKNGVALVRGNGVKAKGELGAVLVIVEENKTDCDIKHWRAVVVDGEKIKPDTWYTLDSEGEVVEA